MMKCYFIEEHLHREVLHGGIGNVDAEKIFLQKKMISIRFPCHYEFSFQAKCRRLYYLLKVLVAIPPQSYVFFQFPAYAGMSRLLSRMLRLRYSLRVVCIVMDIDGIKDGDERKLQAEIGELQRYRYFIVHNENMREWLLSKVKADRVTTLLFFDFLTAIPDVKRTKSFEIAFAGHLGKSGFLQQLNFLKEGSPKLVFNVYGKDPSPLLLQQQNVIYKGCAAPYLLPAIIEGAFGLVWDGDAIDGPGGALGNYMQYITPHKISLYIISGMPVIALSGSACGLLVTKYKIGIVVVSLFELEKALESVSDEQYRQMAENMKGLAAMISAGGMLGNAIDDLVE